MNRLTQHPYPRPLPAPAAPSLVLSLLLVLFNAFGPSCELWPGTKAEAIFGCKQEV
jgi:hypothetical protein